MKQRNDSGGENHRSDEDPNSPSSSSSEIEDSQSQVLPLRKLLIVFPALALVQFTSFLDQTAVSTAQPAISKGLHIGSSISWIGSSFLIASTSIQLINGRLSDIFGRKACLIVSLTVMGIGNLLSGFSWAPGWLYATRAVSGLGAGAINGLVQIAISDITSLKQRGNYFGIIGIAVALGNGLGPVIGGTLTQKTSWRWSLWFVSPLTAVAIVILIATLPPTRVSGNTLHKVKSVDWTGVLLNVMAVTLLLIPISQGGSNISWSSPSIVIMLCIGGALCFVFLVWEGRFAKVPIMPIRLLKNGYSANILLIQNLAIGWVYWGNLYYIPVYFQTIRGYDPSMSGVLLLPMVIAHGIFSGSSGFLVSYTGGYYWILLLGSAVWTIGASLKAKFYEQTTSVWMFIVFGILEGFGVGFCFQPVLVALLASSAKADRAVMTGLRNFLRAMGGAVGLTVSGAILSNILERKLKGKFSTKVIAQLTSSVTDLSSLGISEADQSTILQAYMQGLNAVFISYACLVGLCFLSFTIIKDYGVGGRGDAPKDKDANESATASQIAGIASPSTSKKAEV